MHRETPHSLPQPGSPCSGAFVAHGRQYTIGPKAPTIPRHWKGFGGQWWRVVFPDGRVTETDNLWCGSETPHVDTATLHEIVSERR